MIKPARLVEIRDARLGGGPRLFTTLEGDNPGGSIKDHMVASGLRKLLASGKLGPGKTVAEASAGSTALSLAHYAAELGLGCALFVPDSMEPAKLAAMRRLGADLHPVPLEKGVELYADFCRDTPHVVPFEQGKNPTHREHYHAFGRRIAAELGRVDAVLGAVGTGHSLSGVAEGIAPRPWIATAEPAGFHCSGVRNIVAERQGADDPCVPELFDQRIELRQDELFPFPTVTTLEGPMRFPESFRLVLAAVSRLRARGRIDTVFLVGASNQL